MIERRSLTYTEDFPAPANSTIAFRFPPLSSMVSEAHTFTMDSSYESRASSTNVWNISHSTLP